MATSIFDEGQNERPDKLPVMRLVGALLVVLIAIGSAGFGGFYYAKYQTTLAAVNEMKSDLEDIERKVTDISRSAECDLDGVESRFDDVDKAIKKVGSDLSDLALDISSIESDVSSIQLKIGY